MFKKQHLALAIAATLSAGAAQATLETSVTLKNETAYMLKDGIRTGEATSTTDTTGEGKGVYKFENTAKIYLNDELSNGASWHGELNIVRDSKAIDGYDGHESYTQKDWLRELYVDTTVGDWDLRLGKQQVVWGTADGIKLLDMINPTDWSEFNQNTMAESRIPVWMVNAEKYLDNGSNIQLIASQPKSNKIAGLNGCKNESNHPFIMKGVDSICGQVNGFYNVTPALSKVAATFNGAALGGLFYGLPFEGGLLPFAGMNVDTFAAIDWDYASTGSSNYIAGMYGTGTGQTALGTSTPGASLLQAFAEGGFDPNFATTGTSSDENANVFGTNLTNSTYNPTNPTSAFEYMPLATFATFNSFVSTGSSNSFNSLGGVTSTYKTETSDKPNIGGRFKFTLENGLNASVNFFNHESANPGVYMDWINSSGTKLNVQRAAASQIGTSTYYIPDTSSFTSLTRAEAKSHFDTYGIAPSVLVNDGTDYYGAFDPTAPYGADGSPTDDFAGTGTATGAGSTFLSEAPILQFTQKSHRVNSLGGSFDYAIDTDANPVVLRGEFLYEKGEKQPVIDRFLLAMGDLTNALTMQDADYFKYVIGADTTVATDMMVSGQFIQFRNLDYIDSPETCTNSQSGNSFNCGIYTASFPTMSLTNGLQQAKENQNFYSLFLSKPFGESGEGRWNNIFIYEAGGGKWNRFDVEYGFDDQLIGTFEVNKYFGDNNTMFGQFENASNVQIGLKYLLQ